MGKNLRVDPGVKEDTYVWGEGLVMNTYSVLEYMEE